MITVAIIDDGIYNGLFDIGNIYRSIEITPEITIQDEEKNVKFNSSHGTICAAIVKKYYSEVIFTSVKILNHKTNKGTKEQLVKAIQWCIDNGIQVANLSLGTIDFRDFKLIRDVINRAYDRGLIIVAACNNKDIFTYPASCSNVIGVKSSKIDTLKEGEYIFNLYPLDGIEITACSEHTLLKKNNNRKLTHICNSYATPMITANVCKIIDKHPGINLADIKQKLYQNSINCINPQTSVSNYKNLDWINNAILLYSNGREYNFELPYIKQVEDFKQIQNINVNKFDTLILLSSEIRAYENIIDVVNYFNKNKKNIIVIDNEYKNENYTVKCMNDYVKCWHPSIIDHFYKGVLPRKEIDVPLIMVYGYTESYIIEVIRTLISKFRNDGYYSIGAYTKPIGVLYGFEYLPIITQEKFKQIKNKVEVLYRAYDFDILILGVVINKEDINPKEVNICLNPDITIFLVDYFTQGINKYLEEMNMSETLIITTKDNTESYSYFVDDKLTVTNLDLLYKQILMMFICEDNNFI